MCLISAYSRWCADIPITLHFLSRHNLSQKQVFHLFLSPFLFLQTGIPSRRAVSVDSACCRFTLVSFPVLKRPFQAVLEDWATCLPFCKANKCYLFIFRLYPADPGEAFSTFPCFSTPSLAFFPVLFWAFFPHSSFVLNEFAGGRESWQENKRICRWLSHFHSICCSLSHFLPPLVLSLSSTGVAVAMMAAFVWHRELCYCIYALEHPRSDSHTHKRMYTHTRNDQCPRRFIIKAACGRRFEEQNMKRIKQIVWCRRDRHAVRKYLSSSSRWSAQIPLFLSSLSFLRLHASFVSPVRAVSES